MRTRAGFFMPEIYSKLPLPIPDQIQLLESRGMKIPDKVKAHHYLQYTSYYRLSGYTISFEEHLAGKRSHKFQKGTSFDDLTKLYNFDRQLRIIVIDAIERIEVAIRSQNMFKPCH